jgi:Lrp/AsnC family leucine-responsive transcriptional regulator
MAIRATVARDTHRSLRAVHGLQNRDPTASAAGRRRIAGIVGEMAANPRTALDQTDLTMLRLLQEDGRMTTADLARAIHLSPTATSDRLRRLVDEGVIRGYSAVVDPAALGYGVTAFIRLKRAGSMERFQAFLDRTPQIREAHHVTGEDCCLMKVLSPSLGDLEELANELTAFGAVTTNLVFSTRTRDRPLLPAA